MNQVLLFYWPEIKCFLSEMAKYFLHLLNTSILYFEIAFKEQLMTKGLKMRLKLIKKGVWAGGGSLLLAFQMNHLFLP